MSADDDREPQRRGRRSTRGGKPSKPVPTRPSSLPPVSNFDRGREFVAGWEAFRRSLLEGPSAVEPDINPGGCGSDDLTDEMIHALEAIAALETGRLAPEDVDPRAAARWIHLFGLDALEAMLSGPDDKSRDGG